MVAFVSYGCFWISLVVLMWIPALGLGAAPSETSMGFYFFIWGAFSTMLFVGTLKRHPYAEIFVFASAAILFYLLAI
jgi:succinate-acetate transporter protein